MSKLIQVIGNQKGAMSLVEVLISVGLLTTLAVIGSSYFSSTRRAQQLIELEAALESYHSAFSKIVQDSGNCNATFHDDGGGTSIPAPDEIYLKRDGESGLGKNAASTLPADEAYYSSGDWIKNVDSSFASTQTWFIRDFSFPNGIDISSATPEKDRVLLVTYELNPKIASRVVVKKIPLRLRFASDDSFQECISAEASTVNNLQNTMCNGLNPDDATGSTVVAYWDEDQQKCILTANADPACPAGQTLKGIKADGTLNCMETEEEVDERVVDSTTTTCAAGQSVKIEYVNKKLRIVCQ